MALGCACSAMRASGARKTKPQVAVLDKGAELTAPFLYLWACP